MIGFRFVDFRRAALRREDFRGLPVFFMGACYRRRSAGSIAG
jgi:hypothetical protein